MRSPRQAAADLLVTARDQRIGGTFDIEYAVLEAAVAQRTRTGSSGPKTRQELNEGAKRRNLKGRSKMGQDELARALGHQ